MFCAPLGDKRVAGLIRTSASNAAHVFELSCDQVHVSCEVAPPVPTTAQSLRIALDRAMEASGSRELPSMSACLAVARELESLGWDSVATVDEHFGSVTLRVGDSKQRLHSVKLLLDAHGRPLEAISDTPLPLVVGSTWTIAAAHEHFAQLVRRFQSVWNELERLDSMCRVLDPELPAARAVTYRRLGLLDPDGSASAATLHVQLALDEARCAPCGCDLLGPESAVAVHRERLQDVYRNWDDSATVYDNLARIMALALPCAQAVSSVADVGECGICYTYRLFANESTPVELPDISCECRRPYHRSCLLGWLRALPSSKRSFKLVAGECPYCSAELVVREG